MGFNPDNLATMRIQLPGTKYREPAQVDAFYKQLFERIQSVPGVQSVGAISAVFIDDTPNSTNFSIEGRPVPTGVDAIEVPLDSVSPDYFRVMGIPLRMGREFDDRDVRGSMPVVIINETFVKRFFPDEDPIGKRFVYGTPGPDNESG
jgi:putative ABC transport system permease protein